MDFFNEFIIKKDKDLKDAAIFAGTIIGGLLLILADLVFIPFSSVFFLLFLMAIIYGMYFVITSLNVEYEYSVTNGDVDIDKIIARSRRKRLASVAAKDFEYFAPLNDNHINAYTAHDINKTVNAASSIKSPDAYFALYHNNNEKICLIFEPTEKMINEFALRMPKSVFFTK